MKKVIGLVNFHSSPEVAPITDSRPLGSTSFLGRYAMCDFPLSNFCNSDISIVGLLVKNHQRSILKHLGSMDSWMKNTKTSREIIMYNEPAHQFPELNTDLQNLRENDWALYDSEAEYIVIAPAHIIARVDFRPILDEHIERKEKITVVATKIEDASKSFHSENIIEMTPEGYAKSAYKNPLNIHGPATVSMSSYIINRTVFADMINRSLKPNPTLDLKTLIYQAAQEGTYPVHVHMFEGFVRCIDSFRGYMETCFELLQPKLQKELFSSDWPIYTKSHDTPPALYGENSVIANSMIANGAVIEGTVIDSIIGRDVRVAKGAVVRNSILFSNSKVAENATVENALIDKYACITRAKKVGGTKDVPLYLHQGAIL